MATVTVIAVTVTVIRSVTEMEHIAYALLTCFLLIGVDWALIDGFRMSLASFRDVPSDLNYKKFMFPRLVIVAIAGILIYAASQTQAFSGLSDTVLGSAIAVFLLSSFYPQIVMFLRSKPYKDG